MNIYCIYCQTLYTNLDEKKFIARESFNKVVGLLCTGFYGIYAIMLLFKSK